LFDHPIVYHPGYQEQFERAGHSGVVTFYHAACRDLFCKPPVERIFDVGSVGRTHANVQTTRRRVLTELSKRFRLNEWERFYSYEEMAEVYRQSKIVVNITRDDYQQDANMRAFEAMAAGCLLISRIPTELTTVGFQENVHFVPYRHEREIMGLVSEYLCQNEKLERIAASGREKVLAEHTYDNRAAELLSIIESNKGRLFAPARKWPEARVRLARIDYFSACMELRSAFSELGHVAKRDLRAVTFGGLLIAGALTRGPRARFRSLIHQGS
jgi:glycosyltransferase involved in cell wall biosynthesis